MTGKYDADDLTHLEGLDAVRKRPGMYIGSTDSKGLVHLVWEILDNSVDEALAGHCAEIRLTLHTDGSVSVSDNGRGIPVDVNRKSGLTGVELVMTKLHAGGKFGGDGYKTSGGLHGVGASVVNALSSRVDVTVLRNSASHTIAFQRGTAGTFAAAGPDATFTPKKGLVKGGRVAAKTTGTTVRFWPDKTVFLPDATIDPALVHARARQTAFLLPGLQIVVVDENADQENCETAYRFDGGLLDMVEHLQTGNPLVAPLHITGTGTFTEDVPVLDSNGHMAVQTVERTVEVDVALTWSTGYDTITESFVNVVRTPLGGTHQKGFERGITRTLVDAIKNTRGLLKGNEDVPITDDVLEGIVAAVAVNVPEPQFLGQTKEELGTKGVLKVVETVVANGIAQWLENRRTKAEARLVMDKVVAASRARIAARVHRDAARRKNALEGASMPAKLVDCRSTGIDRSELFIVEGDSALGTAKAARNGEYQALLPIRGKILNVQKATLKQVMENAECASIAQVIGAGTGRTFDVQQMRYGRIILMADADVDGAHIRTLLIALFARYMRPIVEEGRLYAAMPPLHKITVKGSRSEPIYTYTQAEMEREVARLETAGKSVVTPVPRFKGLGEMDADELWPTTMDPSTRSIRRITLADATEADNTLELLMGNKVEPRREWLIANASRATDIDA